MAAEAGVLRPASWRPGQPALATPPPRPHPDPPGAGAATAGTTPPRLLLIDRTDPAVRTALPGLEELLTPPERQRLARLRRPDDRERFLLGRGVLRLCLAELLRCGPRQPAIATGRRGKPFLLPPAGATRQTPGAGPEFNVAHAGELVLLGFHPERPVGVDVERLRPSIAWRPLARRWLAAEALAAIEARPAEQRPRAFLEAWCALEAGLKAEGHGLAGRRGGVAAAALWPVAVGPGHVAAAALA